MPPGASAPGGHSTVARPRWPMLCLAIPPTAPLLEMTLFGGTFQADGPLAMALAGAPIEARTVMPDRSERALRLPSSFSLRDGEQLVLGHMHSGARTYLAVRGGWQTPPVLGSRSSEQALRAGEQLPSASSSDLSRHLAGASWQPASSCAVPDRRRPGCPIKSRAERCILGEPAISGRNAA